jgi:hypothetical protein
MMGQVMAQSTAAAKKFVRRKAARDVASWR